MAIANGKPPACAQCGRRDPKGRVDERQTKEFYCLACWSSYESDRLIEYFDSEAELHAKCQQLAEMISQARHVLAFTGAGISTGAGIADFRSGTNTSLPTGPGFGNAPSLARHRATFWSNACKRLLDERIWCCPGYGKMVF